MFCSVMLRSYRLAEMPRNPTHFPSSEIVKSATVIDGSLVTRVVLRGSRSTAHRLTSGVSVLRMSTVNFFSRRSFSSASWASGPRK